VRCVLGLPELFRIEVLYNEGIVCSVLLFWLATKYGDWLLEYACEGREDLCLIFELEMFKLLPCRHVSRRWGRIEG
jgi:hypothetical protein